MQDYKELVSRRIDTSNIKHDTKKADKLAETKRIEREKKERARADQKAAKDKKRDTALDEAVKHREERALSGAQTKRASRDIREANRREATKAAGAVCEHGIWKCQICNPQPHTGKVNHHKDAAVEPVVFAN